MTPAVRMTGPHPSRIRRGGLPGVVWQVAILGADQQPLGTVYRCLSYRRALSLSCNIAEDRRLFLRVEALPLDKRSLFKKSR
jgi:hypothetical protein